MRFTDGFRNDCVTAYAKKVGMYPCDLRALVVDHFIWRLSRLGVDVPAEIRKLENDLRGFREEVRSRAPKAVQMEFVPREI